MRMVLALIVLIAAVVFAVQNATPVTLNALFWQLEASLAVIIVLCFALGVLSASIAMLPGLLRARNSERRLRARVTELESPANATSTQTPSSEPLPPPPTF
jgi:uncharacterized integral membrane protein